jgi:hypothetical protein
LPAVSSHLWLPAPSSLLFRRYLHSTVPGAPQ